jgi:type II secretory pathway pseudopilin PulG
MVMCVFLYSKTRRAATSLLEVLVAISIIAVLIAILIPAIQKARISANHTEHKNRLKNICLSLIDISESKPKADLFPGSVFRDIVSHLNLPLGTMDNSQGYYPYFLNTYDPSLSYFPSPPANGDITFCFNASLLGTNLNQGVTDGRSSTMLFSERYARCNGRETRFGLNHGICYDSSKPPKQVPCGCDYISRASTFVDSFYCDVCKKVGGGFVTPEIAFQVRPLPTQCDPRLMQSIFSSGLTVACADGSVHVLTQRIDPTIFWALTTPNGGEVVGSFD